MVDPEALRSSQETPRRPPRAPKRSPREPQNNCKTIFGLTFLKVGGAVWELKIDPKKLREEVQNDIEKTTRTRNEKTSSRIMFFFEEPQHF